MQRLPMKSRTERAPAEPKPADMKNPLESLWGTFILGLLLTAILYGIVRLLLAHSAAAGA